jgi:arginyl-tRNA synthetase
MTTITIIDGITGEQITRAMTDDEQAEQDARNAKRKTEQAAADKAEQVAADKRQIILDRLGITYDEFKTILS